MSVKLTEPSLYVHRRLRKLGGWRTAQEVREDVVSRSKGRAMLMQMGPTYGSGTVATRGFAPLAGESLARWEARQWERLVARITSRLVQLRRAGLVKHRIVIVQNRSGTMKPRSEWKAVKRAD